MKRCTLALFPLLSCAAGQAQAGKIDLYTASDLAAREQALKAKVDRATGSAGSVLERYPNHLTMFILRDKDGQAELHQTLADVFIVIDGTAELWTGGKMRDGKATEKNELRGSGLDGGTKVQLGRGDIVHIPAGLPHQLRITAGSHFAYFVVKAQESAEAPSR